MKKNLSTMLPILLLLSAGGLAFTAIGPEKAGDNKKERLFSAVMGTISKTDTVFMAANESDAIAAFELAGAGRNDFVILSADINGNNGSRAVIAFQPPPGKTGVASATLNALDTDGNVLQAVSLRGLSAKGLEGENEPPLSQVLEVLGYRVNLGWTSLANHCEPQMQGDEIPAGTFMKAGEGPVRITPLARYSPDFKLPFGYYSNGADGPVKHAVGALALAGAFPEHQTLFPATAGDGSFDPGSTPFGLYVSGPDHTAYSEDRWNELYHPESVAHATRIYQAIDRQGKTIKNAYLVCFEEASNGDYNDYVFLLENIALPH